MKLTKGDKVLVVFLVVLSVFIAYFAANTNKGTDKYISIQVDGKEINAIKFSKDNVGKTYIIETEFGRNVLEFGEGNVKIIEASCLDKICIKQGQIEKIGQTLICLPNRLVIEIKSLEDSPSEIDSFTF